jgi:hypothetical protein
MHASVTVPHAYHYDVATQTQQVLRSGDGGALTTRRWTRGGSLGRSVIDHGVGRPARFHRYPAGSESRKRGRVVRTRVQQTHNNECSYARRLDLFLSGWHRMIRTIKYELTGINGNEWLINSSLAYVCCSTNTWSN